MKKVMVKIIARIVTFLMASVILMSGCNKVGEAYHGEKTLENTAWGVYDDKDYQAKLFVVFYSYDEGCDVCITGSDGAQCRYKGLYVFDGSAHKVEIRPVTDEDTPDTIPTGLTGTVDATGLTLEWYFYKEGDIGRIVFSRLFTYICPADELG